jgi:hypothetical protein
MLRKGTRKFLPRTGHEGPDRKYRYSSTLSLTSALDGGWVVHATPRSLCPRGRDLAPTRQGAGWAPEQVWKGASFPPGFDPRTVQPVASLEMLCGEV